MANSSDQPCLRETPFWENLAKLCDKPYGTKALEVREHVRKIADLNFEQSVEDLRGFLAGQVRADVVDFLVAQARGLQQYVNRLRAALERLGPGGVDSLFLSWAVNLGNSLSQVNGPEKPILCAFSCNQDVNYQLDQTGLDGFIDWAAGQTGLGRGDFLKGAQGRYRPGSRKAENLMDVLSFLISAFEKPGSGPKVSLVKPDVRNQMKAYMGGIADLNRQIGGGSGNAAWILRNLGLSVHAHWPYHPPEIAGACPECLQRVLIGEDGVEVRSAREEDPQAPNQPSYVLGFPSGLKIQECPGGEKPALAQSQTFDRALFAFAKHSGGLKGWSRVKLVAANGTAEFVNITLDEDEWPFFPLFGSWRTEGDTLVFRAADDQTMEEVAKQGYKGFILSGLHKVKDYPEEIQQLIRRELRRQLEVLKKNGIPLHVEFSGPLDAGMLDFIRSVIRRRAFTAGFNREELERYTGLVDTRYFSFPAPTIWPESPYQRYQRALHFARTFNLEWLYVHSEDLNLVVRRDASKDELSDQRDALLLAKLAVPKAIVVRSLPAEEVPKWEAKVVPTLAEKGFISLILFAYEYAQAEAANEDQFEKIFRSLVLKGYHCRQPGEEEPYSVIAVPVVWPEMPDNINTVGAGDMSSALVRALTP